MDINVSSSITINYPTDEVKEYIETLQIPNPEYIKKQRMGLWIGNTSPLIYLYRTTSAGFQIPYGFKDKIKNYIRKKDNVYVDFINNTLKFNSDIPLYDYQKAAVNKMFKAGYGILQSKAGSGKTQMGLALALKHCAKVLWITHTKDLLRQSYERAKQYVDGKHLGIAAEGKADIKDITFATIQTLANMDLTVYKYYFGVVIVDECHRVCGGANKITQFSRVLNSLAAPHKYGLSATVHRADKLEKCIFAYLGPVKYKVPDEAIADKVLDVSIQKVETDISIEDIDKCLDTDGTLIYSKFITELGNCHRRNIMISNKITAAKFVGRQVLVLSERIGQLEELKSICNFGKILTGKTKKNEREQIIKDMQEGKEKVLYSTYSLAKEGLDITSLDTLILATPVKDYAIVIQAVGRVARKNENKHEPIVLDFVDVIIGRAVNMYKQRVKHYKAGGYKVCN